MDEIQIKNNAQLRRVRMAAMLEQEIMHYAWKELSRNRPLTAAVTEHQNRMEHRNGPAMQRQYQLEPFLPKRSRRGHHT